MLRMCLTLLVSLLPTLAFAAPTAYNMKLDKTVEVKPLDDPQNPYKDQYGEWDEWLIEHAQPAVDGNPLVIDYPYDDQHVLDGWVNEEGWLLPQTVAQKLLMQWYQEVRLNPHIEFPYYIDGAGPMAPELMTATRKALAEARAPFYPPVPGWLKDASPEWSMILPDGRVVVQGIQRLDQWPIPEFNEWQISDSSMHGWQLYSPQGELLKTTLPQSWWWELTMPDFRQRIGGYNSQYLNVVAKFGHIHIYDMDTRQTYANYDWDGSPLPANLKLHDGRDGCPFLGISGYDLPIMYAEQQRLTKTQ